MKKQIFYAFHMDSNTCERYVEPMEGYVDEPLQVAYVNTHDEGDNKWVSVCLVAGMSLFYKKTRKELEEKTKKDFWLIEKSRNNPTMGKYIQEYKKLKEEYKKQ